MQVRDARERDAPTMAELTDAPEEVLRNVVHERSVRVLVDPADGGDGDGDSVEGDDESEAGNDVSQHGDDESENGNAESPGGDAALRGFVSFDARADAVHVTQFGGDTDACERLLAEPMSFARSEGLAVEVLLQDGDDAMRAAVDATGFEHVGEGPRFGGERTQRYRYDPT